MLTSVTVKGHRVLPLGCLYKQDIMTRASYESINKAFVRLSYYFYIYYVFIFSFSCSCFIVIYFFIHFLIIQYI